MDLLGILPQLAGLIEKGGIVGLMLIFGGVLVWEIRRGRRREHELRGQMQTIYMQRDKWRLAYVKCKTACDAAGLKVDLSDMADLIGEGGKS